MAIFEEISTVLNTKFANKNAIILRNDEFNEVSLSYEDVQRIFDELHQIFTKHGIKGSSVGLQMTHNILIPSLIMCLLKNHCPFCFLEENYDQELINRARITWIIQINQSSNEEKDFYCQNFDVKKWEFVQKNIFFDQKLEFYKQKKLTKIDFPHNIPMYEDICYIVQTSGSVSQERTLVYVENYCIKSNIDSLRDVFKITEEDLIYFGTPLTFDPAIVELFLALFTGACLLITTRKTRINPKKLLRILFPENYNINSNNQGIELNEKKESKIKKAVSFVQMPPSVFLRWSEKDMEIAFKNLRILALGGEKFPPIISQLNLNLYSNLQIFNLYGITEVSCWASVCQIANFDEDIHLGICLKDTSFKIQEDGELYIESNKRICYLNEEIQRKQTKNSADSLFSRPTGDLVQYKNGKYYFVGRKNQTIKRFGHRINLCSLENLVFSQTSLNNVFLSSCDEKLVVYFEINDYKLDEKEKIIDKLRVKLLKTLSNHEQPDYIEILRKFPLTNHGKIDRKKLASSKTAFVNIHNFQKSLRRDEAFLKLVQSYLGVIITNLDLSFMELGGNSVLSLQLLSEFEFEFTFDDSSSKSEFVNKFFDGTLHDCIKILQRKEDESVSKSKKRNVENNEEGGREKFRRIENNQQQEFCQVLWKFDMKACVDASPTVFKQRNKLSVAVGAFSNKFAIIDVENGQELSSILLGDAIENASLFLQEEDCLIVCCRDSFVYCLSINDCSIIWKFQAQNSIKNVPVLCLQNKAICFGSYDKNVYCLNKKTGFLIWKTQLDAAIGTNPLYSQPEIIIGTLNGKCYCLQEESGQISWIYNSNFPIFSPPISLKNQKLTILTSVNGTIHCVKTSSGDLRWKIDVQNSKSNQSNSIFAKSLVCQNKLFVTSLNGILNIFNVSENHCSLFKQIVLFSTSSSLSLSIDPVKLNDDDNEILFVLNSGEFIKLSISDYSIQSNVFALPAQCFSSPKVFDKRIFIGCRDNYFYCLKIL